MFRHHDQYAVKHAGCGAIDPTKFALKQSQWRVYAVLRFSPRPRLNDNHRPPSGSTVMATIAHPPPPHVGLRSCTAVKVDSAWSVRYRSSARSWAECSIAEAGGTEFERCLQVRERHAFRGAGSKRGWYYFATTRQMKWCESRFEMRALRALDHDPEVAAVAVQPFILHYRDEIGRASHTPDVFVRNRNGSGSVVDARPERFVEKPDFLRQRAAMEETCAAAGWSYSVCSTIDPVFEANLDWLAPCRHQLVDPLGCADEVLAACAEPQRLGEIVAAFPPAALTRPVISHLLWASRLLTDLSILLSDASVLSVPMAPTDAN